MPGVEPRPRIEGDLSNMPDVLAYFRTHGPHVGFQRGFHAVMDKLVEPNVVMPDGVAEEISEHLDSGNPTILVMTHHSWFDPSNDAAALQQRKDVFDEAIGKFVVPARMDYFDIPLIGSIISIGGAKPIARRKDVANYYASQGLSEDEIKAKLETKEGERKGYNNLTQQVMVDMLMEGFIDAYYIEGTRNRGDQSKLQKVRDGVKDLLETVPEAETVKIICLSHDYGGARILPRRFLTPTISINVVDAPANPEEVNSLLHETLEQGMHHARANRREGAPLSPLGKALSLAAIAGAAVVADKLMARD